MNYEGIYGGPFIYSHVYSQFMADTTKSRKNTLKPIKAHVLLQPSNTAVTEEAQMTPSGPTCTAILSDFSATETFSLYGRTHLEVMDYPHKALFHQKHGLKILLHNSN